MRNVNSLAPRIHGRERHGAEPRGHEADDVGAAGPALVMERWRRAPAFALASVVALLLAGLLIGAYGERLYREQRAQEAGIQARMLAASVAEALEFEDMSTARENVGALRANPGIEAAAVYDADGTMVAGYVRRGGPLPPQATGRFQTVDDDRILLAIPVVHLGQQVGTVRLRTSVEPLARRLTRYSGIALLAIMGSLVIAVLSVAHAAMRRVNAELAASNRRLRAEASEREQAEEALRQAQKMQAVGQLTGGKIGRAHV